ncbi:MAG TPA: hypothetical protein VFX12_02530 [Vicinamibacterales bacterium]|nr:hypothetical protein [Vicinamibacterales bacterium]
MRRLAFVAACVVGLVASLSAAPAPDLVGTWTVSFNTQQGVIPAQLTLAKEGDRITGTIASDMGQAPVEASLKDTAVEIDFNFTGPDGSSAPVSMAGTIDGDSMKGTLAYDGSDAGDWTATRAPAKDKDKDKTNPSF